MDFFGIITTWLNGLGNWIGDLFSNIDDLLSSIVGIIPRTIVFIRQLFMPLYEFINKVFPQGFTGFIFGNTIYAMLFYSVIGFIVALALKRGVVK